MTSEKQKLLDKMERKDKRRVAKGRAGADADVDWLMAHGFDALVEAEIMRETEGQVLAHQQRCATPSPADAFSTTTDCPSNTHLHTGLAKHLLLAQGGALVVGDLEFKVAGDEGSLWTRGTLPKGTTRK